MTSPYLLNRTVSLVLTGTVTERSPMLTQIKNRKRSPRGTIQSQASAGALSDPCQCTNPASMLTHARSHLRACASATATQHCPRMMWPSPYPAAELAGGPPRTSLPVAPAKGALDIPLADAAAAAAPGPAPGDRPALHRIEPPGPSRRRPA